MKGIRFAKGVPSPYLYQSLALLASELELYDEARQWYRFIDPTLPGSEFGIEKEQRRYKDREVTSCIQHGP